MAGIDRKALRRGVETRLLISQHFLDDFVEPYLIEGRGYLMLRLLPREMNHQDRARFKASLARRLIFFSP
jgi:hypothetical protein